MRMYSPLRGEEPGQPDKAKIEASQKAGTMSITRAGPEVWLDRVSELMANENLDSWEKLQLDAHS